MYGVASTRSLSEGITGYEVGTNTLYGSVAVPVSLTYVMGCIYSIYMLSGLLSSSRPNSNIDELLSGFEEWLRRQ